MLNLIISLLSGALLAVLLGIWLSPIEAVIPGVVLFAALYFLLARRAMKRLEAIFLAAQKELMAGRIEKGIKIMETARSLARWQFMVGSQVDAQVGMVLFVREDFKAAQPHLEKAFSRIWIASAMLGSLHYKKKNVEQMRRAFDKAVAVGKKQGLAWQVYAWCEWKLGNPERAIEILSRGSKALKEEDERLKNNLLALQNGKKMKMKPHGEQWYQFHLEKMPVQKMQQVRFARR